MDMKSTFIFTLVSFCPNVTGSYFLSTINERYDLCSPTLSLSGRLSPWMHDFQNTVSCLYSGHHLELVSSLARSVIAGDHFSQTSVAGDLATVRFIGASVIAGYPQGEI